MQAKPTSEPSREPGTTSVASTGRVRLLRRINLAYRVLDLIGLTDPFGVTSGAQFLEAARLGQHAQLERADATVVRVDGLAEPAAHLVEVSGIGAQAAVQLSGSLRDLLCVLVDVLLPSRERHGPQERDQKARCRDQHTMSLPSLLPDRRLDFDGRVKHRVGRHVHHHEIG